MLLYLTIKTIKCIQHSFYPKINHIALNCSKLLKATKMLLFAKDVLHFVYGNNTIVPCGSIWSFDLDECVSVYSRLGLVKAVNFYRLQCFCHLQGFSSSCCPVVSDLLLM